jgi:predicted AlkP superfamily phosphohydrolase/phosphomutase
MDDSSTGGVEMLLVGIDAACPRVLDPLMDAGAVPTLQRIFEEGASSPLESQVPPWTASAWPSLYTGVNPGKHGVFGFLTFDGYDWSVVDGTCVREWSLWETLDRRGRSSVVVNAPVAHPPPAIDGAVVPGYVAPDDPPCHPEGVLELVREAVGEYRVYPTTDDPDDDRTIPEYRRLAELRGEAFRVLADRFDPDFGFLQFQVTDSVLHTYPGDLDRAAEVYAAVDDAIADVLADCDPDTVVVASDHGIGPYTTRFRVNEFLRDRGYVAATTGGDGMPQWSAVRDGELRAGANGSGPGIAARAVALAAKLGVTSQRVGSALDRVGLADAAMRLVPDDAVRAGSEQVDFPESRAYVRNRTESGVRVNLRGREPDGVVPQDRYEVVRTDLVDHLSGAKAPDGKPVFDEVARREEFFDGPYVENAPDVVAIPRDFDVYLTTWLLGDHFEEPDEPTWDHTMTGVFAATGDAIDADADLADPDLLDVAPTVLAALGVPASERMDGDPLPVAEPVGTTTYPEYDCEPADGTADAAVEDRLGTLGYLE